MPLKSDKCNLFLAFPPVIKLIIDRKKHKYTKNDQQNKIYNKLNGDNCPTTTYWSFLQSNCESYHFVFGVLLYIINVIQMISKIINTSNQNLLI